MTWLTASDYKLPDKDASTADFILAYDVRSDLMNAIENFLKDQGPQYATPDAYTEAMIVWAQSIVHFSPYLVQAGWNPTRAAILASFSCFDMLKKMSAHPLDPENTQSIYDAWTKVPTVVISAPVNDGVNEATGPSSVQSGTVFGGSKQ